MPNKNLYDALTNKTIKLLKEADPKLATKSLSDSPPFNPATDQVFGDEAIFILNLAFHVLNPETNNWLTFKQANQNGGKIKKGADAVPIPRWYNSQNNQSDNIKTVKKDNKIIYKNKSQNLHYSNLFNIKQCEQLAKTLSKKSDHINNKKKVKHPEKIFATIEKNIKTQKNGHYQSETDQIITPSKNDCGSLDLYYFNLAHNFIHWSGKQNRTKRFQVLLSNSEQPKEKEELVANIGANIITRKLGFNPPPLKHPEHIDDWIELMIGDNKVLTQSILQAKQAVNYLDKRLKQKKCKKATKKSKKLK